MDAIARAVPPVRALSPHASRRALAELDDGTGPESGRAGDQRRPRPHAKVFEEFEAEEHFEEDDLVGRLTELRESLRKHYNVGQTLQEKLADAIATEQYELAATLRDELARRLENPR